MDRNIPARIRRLIGVAGGALCASIALVIPQSAFAAPVTLVCQNDTRPDFGEITLDLDEPAATATLNYPARMIPNGSLPPISSPARSLGPFTAQFDPKTIMFDHQESINGSTRYDHYTVDRVTGVLLDYDSMYAPWDRAAQGDQALYHYSCHVGQKQF